MRIVVTGADGQLGRRLLLALASRGHVATGLDVGQFDITDPGATQRAIGEIMPDLVIHCAAMTQVDRCAEQPDEALRVNGFGTQNVALACQRCQSALAYVSTNEVFDGQQVEPYLEYDTPKPINPYGYSKWVGERAVSQFLSRHYIIRTSWLFSHGGKNFVQRLLLSASQRVPLSVVTDEVAAPTYSEDLVEAIARLVETEHYGIYHLVNAGSASRYRFARHALDCAGYADVPITPILSVQYPRPSRPPTYSTLRNFSAALLGIELRPWQAAVEAFFVRERAQAVEA